jgi:putative SOS response-associated peptidase YedK
LLAFSGSPIYLPMCTRYSLTSPPEAVRATFAYRDTPNFPIRYNIAPTQDIGVVCVDADGQRRFRMMRWGLLPSFVRDPKAGPPMINARAEGISTKSAFCSAFAERRCLVPADGFYEWTGPKGARRPFLVRPRKGGRIAFAAIWERWRDRAGGEIDSVAIITCDANATVTPLHDRMPVVLRLEHFEAWLDCKTTELKAAQDMLQPAPDDLLEAIEMHPQINDSRRDEPGIQQPLQTQLLL